jgi:hypothetical protein
MDVTMKLRVACRHDSRSVAGCTNCEAADEIEALRRMVADQRKTTHEGECRYPDCHCPLDAPADPDWCAKGLALHVNA